MDDPCLMLSLGILVSIKTGPVAYWLSWWWQDGCHFDSFVMYTSGSKFRISLKQRKLFQKESAILLYIEKPFK